ncbi:hypothetical protein BH10ACI4_BH10ACI4_26430 [soil metagenome]
MAHLRFSRLSRRSVAGLSMSLLVLLILLWGSCLLRPAIRARYFVRQLEWLQVGHSTFEDAQRLAKKLGAKPEGNCDRSYCFWDIVVNNARLPQWWRGSGVTFVITFNVSESVVVHKGAGVDIGLDPNLFTPSKVLVVVKESWTRLVSEPPTQKGWGTSYFENHGHRENVSTKFEVHMTPRSSAEDWRRYTAFNYSCFWKYKGCRDARDLLPTADPFPENAFPERK